MKIEMLEDDDVVDFEEAHYVQTLNDVVELMVVYGFDSVMDDILTKLGDVKK